MIPTQIFEKTLLAFFAPIRPYLDDPTVSEIMINGPDRIYVERGGVLTLVDARFDGKEALTAAIRNLSQYVGKPVSAARPILEGRMPDGSRVEAILPPIAPDGPHVSIRRFFKEALTVERLVGFDSLTRDAADALRAFVVSKCNILVAGGTGSGKTSMLNALSGFIPDGERVVVIEEADVVALCLLESGVRRLGDATVLAQRDNPDSSVFARVPIQYRKEGFIGGAVIYEDELPTRIRLPAHRLDAGA